MSAHLNDEQWAEALASEADAEACAHIESCAACAAERARLADAFAMVGEATRAMARREERFWHDQRRGIAARWQEGPKFPHRRAAWAAGLVGVSLAAVFLVKQGPPAADVSRVDEDHVLLVEVERSVRREVPVALEPATLLAAEMHRAAKAQQKR